MKGYCYFAFVEKRVETKMLKPSIKYESQVLKMCPTEYEHQET
jgi:hypothetical protein